MQELQLGGQRLRVILHVLDRGGSDAHMLIPDVKRFGLGDHAGRVSDRASNATRCEAQGFGVFIHDPRQILTGRAFFNVQALDHFFTSGTN